MAYRVEFAPRAGRQFEKLPRQIQVRLKTHIDALADHPRPPRMERLSSQEELCRIRVGDYRVVYVIEDEVLLVLVVGVGHRRDIYRLMFT